jgi:cobalt-precorrin 5A hydrolase
LEEPSRGPATAVIALTRGGAQTGRRLHDLLPESVLYVPTRFSDPVPDGQRNVVSYDTSVRQVLQSAFQAHSALVCIMASGIVVRELAPLLRSKHVDPAVVVLDEAGQYAVSLLGGHKGGANSLAREIADLMAGTTVLTTSSDVQKLPALDLLGRGRGWTLTRHKYMTEVIGALVNGEVVGVVQDAGDEDWWPDPVPANLVRYSSLETLEEATPLAALIITHRFVSQETLDTLPHSIMYHPPCLVVGVGCNRGTPAHEIEEAIERTLAEAVLEPQSVVQLASIEDKEDEPGLQAVASTRGWPVLVFSREEVSAVTNVPNPSKWAQEALGVPGVAEPAALLGANAASLLVEKCKFPNVTVAVALIAGRSVK